MASAKIFPKMPLNKGDLRQCLAVWKDQPDMAIATAATQTGLSRQRVSNAKQWAVLGNLLNTLGLTNEGELALEKDPYLEATVTDWLVHFFCSFSGHGLQAQPQNLSAWGLWSYFVYDFLPSHSTFTQAELARSASKHFEDEKLSDRIQVLLKSYLKEEAITNCKFLTYENSFYATGASKLENGYTVGYLLASIWKRDFGSQPSVLISDLIHSSMGLCQVLAIDETQLHEQMNHLADLAIIEQRSAKPYRLGNQPERRQKQEEQYIVVRCWDTPHDLLVKAYEQDPAVPNRPLIQSLESILGDDEDDLPPFLSSVQNLLSSFRPQQPELPVESTSISFPLHLAS